MLTHKKSKILSLYVFFNDEFFRPYNKLTFKILMIFLIKLFLKYFIFIEYLKFLYF